MPSKNKLIIATLLIILAVVISGCVRERPSDNPPIHINPNMDNQPKYRSQSESKFFADGSAMREPVAGTVARGELRDSIEYYTGKDEHGEFIDSLPPSVVVTTPLLKRGQVRYNIFCSPCHSRVGDGKGTVVARGYVPPPTFHSDRLRDVPNGHVFDVITNGLRNMPTYRYQIPVDDRWAIVTYFRELQRNQAARGEDTLQTTGESVR